jgi:hypothetical protein
MMMKNVIFLMVILMVFGRAKGQRNITCDESVKCDGSLEPEDCPVGTYDPKGTKGCCPGCRKGLEWGSFGCNDKKASKRCAPGLKCVNPNCILDRGKI